MSTAHERSQQAVDRIDDFFETESRVTEEEKLRAGIECGLRMGIFTEQEAQVCIEAFLSTRDTDVES